MPDQIAMANGSHRLKILLPSVSICLGLILADCGAAFQGDTVSYLDMGDYFFAGDGRAILNGLWSPLFPFIHGLTRWIIQPTMRWEPLLFQLTNFAVYVSTVLAFQFFWSQVSCLYRFLSQRESHSPHATFSESEFWVLGYAIFLFMQLDLMTFMSPDMLLSTIVYLTVGLVLKIRLHGPTLVRFCLLGLLLGVGFLAKAVMLPLAGTFLAAAVLSNFRRRFLLSYALAASVVFAGVVSPYIYELSRQKGHFTTGEAARLNYAWHVDDAPFTYWQGELAELGKPEHPPRQIFSSPLVYEFATPIRGTYPPWYDPSYWEAGLRVRFDLGGQAACSVQKFESVLESFVGAECVDRMRCGACCIAGKYAVDTPRLSEYLVCMVTRSGCIWALRPDLGRASIRFPILCPVLDSCPYVGSIAWPI